MYVDANVFIHAALDTGSDGETCRAIIKAIEDGHPCSTSCLALDEVAWIVRRHRGTETAAKVWDALLGLPNLRILPVDEAAASRIPNLMRAYDLHPRDAVHAAVMAQHAVTEIVSSDEHFDRVRGLKRVAPTEFRS